MTEQEWLAATDPTPMLEFLKGRPSDRKLLLFGVQGCCIARRNGETGVPDVERVVRRADGADNLGELERAGFSLPERPVEWCEAFIHLASDRVADENTKCLPTLAELVALCHELFGNPFRPVTLDPDWLTSDVRLLAQGIYDQKASDRMPILADALQDAGCNNDELLNHCRHRTAHVRGCWVIDLLLDKS